MDSDIIAAAVSEWQQGHPITDLQARVIASNWHGGQTTALYSFSSCGNTRDRHDHDPCEVLLYEIGKEVREYQNAPEREELQALAAYVTRVGPRGPVDGWSRLSW